MTGWACSDADAVAAADAVFSGEVVGLRERNGRMMTFTVDVDERLVGQVGDSQRVRSATSSAACGVEVARGDRVLVFASAARIPSAGRSGVLDTTVCSGTRVLGGPVPEAVRAAGAVPTVACADAVDTVEQPPAGFHRVADAVAFPDGPIGLETEVGPPYFAKAGLLVRQGSPVELAVPSGWRVRTAIGWGQVPPAARLRVPACPVVGAGGWTVFAGGFTVDGARCAPVTVVAGRTRTVHVPIGRACP